MCGNVEGSRSKAVPKVDHWLSETFNCILCNFGLKHQGVCVVHSVLYVCFNSFLLRAMILGLISMFIIEFRCCHMMRTSIEIPTVVSERVVRST